MVLPATQGLPPDARVSSGRLRAMGTIGKKGWVDLQLAPEKTTSIEGHADRAEDRTLLPGDWICVEKERLLQASDAVYYFQILGCEVRESAEGDLLGEVVEVYETAAHTIVDIKKRDGGKIVSIPLVDAFVEMHLSERRLIISAFQDFDI